MPQQAEIFSKNTQGYDLHTHSTASDGSLTPQELIDTAIDYGITHLALSDHDTLKGFEIASEHLAKQSSDLQLVPSVEFSSRWNALSNIDSEDDGRGMTVHIVALNIDPKSTSIQKLIGATQSARNERNERLKIKFIKKGWQDVINLAEELSSGATLTRTHIANAMLTLDKVSKYGQAFSRYLGSGKPLSVHTKWPSIRETVDGINKSGGTAVLAHPLHYQLTRKKLLQLCSDFKKAGGQAIEVITGNPDNKAIENLTGIALRQNLAASVGSDFHAPRNGKIHLGVPQVLPLALTPVWEIW